MNLVIRRAITKRRAISHKKIEREKKLERKRINTQAAIAMLVCFGRTNIPIKNEEIKKAIDKRINYLKRYGSTLDVRRQWITTKEEENALLGSKSNIGRVKGQKQGTIIQGFKPNRPKVCGDAGWKYLCHAPIYGSDSSGFQEPESHSEQKSKHDSKRNKKGIFKNRSRRSRKKEKMASKAAKKS